MSCLQTFVYSVILGLTLADPKCGINEVQDDCPANCSYENCPTNNLQDSVPCPKPQQCPPAGCKCGFNYRRAENGTCIQTTACPPFPCTGPNEVYDPCPSYCPGQGCDSATPHGECPYFMLIVVECTPSCRCVKNYWRKNGVCVPYEECLK